MPPRVDWEEVKKALNVVSRVIEVMAAIVSIKFVFVGDPPHDIKNKALTTLLRIKEHLKEMRKALTHFDPETFVMHYNSITEEVAELLPDVRITPLSAPELHDLFMFMARRPKPVSYYIIKASITATLFPTLARAIRELKTRRPKSF